MNERIRHIDGLRGIAVLGVVLYHSGVHDAAMRAAALTPITFLLRQACHGVDLFFVLSGFCLSYPILARLHTAGRAAFNIPAYGARRIVRIVPPYYAAIAVFAVLGCALLALHIPLPEAMSREALTFGGIVKQLLFLDRDRQFLDSSFWTLAVEFRWYFVFPVVLWLWVRFPRAFGMVAIAAVICSATRIDNADVFFLPFFMLGIVAAELHVRSTRLPVWAFAATALVLGAAAAVTSDAPWVFEKSGPFWGVAMFGVVVIVGATPVLRRLTSSAWIVAIGAASYGIYLIHEPLVALIERFTAPYAGANGAFVLAVAGALAAGLLFSYVAERPFVKSRLRDRIIGKLAPSISSMLKRLELRDVTELHRASSAQTEELVA